VYGHEHVAASLGNIGNVLDEMGKPEEALVTCNRVLRLSSSSLGASTRAAASHLDVASTYQNLAALYQN